ncbi:MAG: 2-amino-4-hydroxy-6-hydroxymethyldihydropteridine diphosphokinase [Armatimonadetes bacterium]|nr:2-amino-4-hydroxy-6-hydroxymethyldihydropteridine diphosphokinase [Armatimonadota bacterium]
MSGIYLGLGSNRGDRARFLCAALRLLRERGVRVCRASSLYETAPVGVAPQRAFLNAVVAVETSRAPDALLEALHAVERALGRRRTVRWGPRTIDLDLLLYGDRRLDDPGLRVPHPRMHERGFVLVPLLELHPDARIPGVGPARDCLAALDAEAQPARRLGPLPCP